MPGGADIAVVYATATKRIERPDAPGQYGVVRKGSHWPADDPVVKANPEVFSSDPRYGLEYSRAPAGFDDPPVEQVTRAPGEKRNVRRAG